MSNSVEMMAAAVREKPHSFQFIRKMTGLTVIGEREIRGVSPAWSAGLNLVRFLARDDEGTQIRPGRPGVGLRRGRKV